MLNTDYEVCLNPGNEKSYVIDLNVETMRRADGFHSATNEEEKSQWIADDLTSVDLEKLIEIKRELAWSLPALRVMCVIKIPIYERFILVCWFKYL